MAAICYTQNIQAVLHYTASSLLLMIHWYQSTKLDSTLLLNWAATCPPFLVTRRSHKIFSNVFLLTLSITMRWYFGRPQWKQGPIVPEGPEVLSLMRFYFGGIIYTLGLNSNNFDNNNNNREI